MSLLMGWSALILLIDGIDKLDRHPIPPSAYAEVGLGALLVLILGIGWILGKTLEDDE